VCYELCKSGRLVLLSLEFVWNAPMQYEVIRASRGPPASPCPTACRHLVEVAALYSSPRPTSPLTTQKRLRDRSNLIEMKRMLIIIVNFRIEARFWIKACVIRLPAGHTAFWSLVCECLKTVTLFKHCKLLGLQCSALAIPYVTKPNEVRHNAFAKSCVSLANLNVTDSRHLGGSNLPYGTN